MAVPDCICGHGFTAVVALQMPSDRGLLAVALRQASSPADRFQTAHPLYHGSDGSMRCIQRTTARTH